MELVGYEYVAKKAWVTARRINGAWKHFDNPPKKAGNILLPGAGRGKTGFNKIEVDEWIDSFNGGFRKALAQAECVKHHQYKHKIYIKDEQDFVPIRKKVVIDQESPIHQGFLFNKTLMQVRLAA